MNALWNDSDMKENGSRGPATISDVAQHAGVSRATVSYALTQPERLSSAMLVRVTAAIDELGYVRNNVARQLRVGRSQALGFIVSNAANPFFTELALGAEEEAARRGYYILVANAHEELERERDYVAFFESQQVSGVLIAPIGEVPGELLDLRERGTPFVLVGVPPTPQDYPSISGDNVIGGYLAASHLIDQGRRNLLFAGGSHHNVDSRREGARKAMAEAGGNVHMEFVDVEHQTAGAGERVARDLLARGPGGLPDGIFAGNDLIALGILHVLINGGVRVPEDISLIGYDDIEFAEFAIVPLSSIRHPSRIVGASAVRLLLGDNGDELQGIDPRFAPELVIRGSSLPTGS